MPSSRPECRGERAGEGTDLGRRLAMPADLHGVLNLDLLREGTRFLGASIVATAVQYALLVLLVEAAASDPLLAAALAFAVGAVVNYLLRRNFVFRRNTPHRRSVPRFLVVALVGVGMNSLIMLVGFKLLGLPYLISQIIATGMIFFWNFLAHRNFTFAPEHAPHPLARVLQLVASLRPSTLRRQGTSLQVARSRIQVHELF